MSGLQLNGPVLDYKAFPGEGAAPSAEQMPLLIAEGRTPLSVAGLMRRRLEVLEQVKHAPVDVRAAYESVMRSWWDAYFDTGDGVVRHGDGRLKVVLDAQYLRVLGPETPLVDGAVALSDDVYRGLEGEEFSPGQVERFFNKPLSRTGAKENPGWLALAGGDKALLREYVDVTFAQAGVRFRYAGEMMGVYHESVPENGAAGRLWFVSGLYGNIDYSRAVGSLHLGYYDGRLVGVREAAPEAPRDDGTQIVRPTLDQMVNAVLSASSGHVPENTRVGFEGDVRQALKPLYQ